MKTKYIITGDHAEVATITENIPQEERFLSDTANVEEFVMYETAVGWLAVEITVSEGKEVALEDLALLTSEFTSLTIAVGTDDAPVVNMIAEGVVETV